jgi:hypothetical protein
LGAVHGLNLPAAVRRLSSPAGQGPEQILKHRFFTPLRSVQNDNCQFLLNCAQRSTLTVNGKQVISGDSPLVLND